MKTWVSVAAKACASLLRGGRTSWPEPTITPSSRAMYSARSGTSSTPLKYRSSAIRPGGLTQPNPPPSMMAASAASHSAARSSSLSAVARSTAMLGRGGGSLSAMSGLPAQEVAKNAQADLLAFFDVELSAGTVSARHHGDHLAAVFGGGDALRPVAAGECVAVHEIGVVARQQPVQQLVGARLEDQLIPAHLRQAQPAGGRHGGDLAADPAEARRHRVLQPALGHQLHADADAQEGFSTLHPLQHRLAH